ncbi:unnamed protein product [Adineta steineri]|uniref:Uncharacterized protein n=1 Tax=Adineta steineri TaxID=433720 RepID=A0A814D146_9BILA|nr:unnamed protein product [Adineta steineri]CAF0914785.1 unnamed protein product [Adineta steineri]CAF0947411.1 unnamed protein product [Adineta steineri]CAF3516862.1 unnamed protein product [Adineta steineri]CAF3697934.1 unnamed protein product [Adineta steineri]
MEQNSLTLLITIVLAAVGILFTIIGVATPGWGALSGRVSLFRCGSPCVFNYTAAGVLLLIAILFLVIAIVFTLMFWRGMISNSSDIIKSIVLVLFVVAAIFITVAYSRATLSNFYSYHIAVTAGNLVFLSALSFAYWLGRTSVTFVH